MSDYQQDAMWDKRFPIVVSSVARLVKWSACPHVDYALVQSYAEEQTEIADCVMRGMRRSVECETNLKKDAVETKSYGPEKNYGYSACASRVESRD